MAYRGKWVYTVQPDDVGKRYLTLEGRSYPLSSFMGYVQPCDVGKQIWVHCGVYSVENEEQMEHRLGIHIA